MASRKLTKVEKRVLDAVMPSGGQVIQIPRDLVQHYSELERKESPSSIRNFLGCPLYWYVQRYAPIDGEVDPPGYHAVIGSFVHRILEVFFSEPSEERTLDLLNTLFREGVDAIKQGNAQSGIIDPGLQSEFDYVKVTAPKPASEGGWGLPGMTEDRVVGAFFKQASTSINNAAVFYPEPETENIICTETWARITILDIPIRMKIDMIREKPTGVEVIDYKTGRAPDESNEQDDMECLRDGNGDPVLDSDGNKILLLSEAYIAMGIYALAVRMGCADGVDPVMPRRVQMHYLKELVNYSAQVRSEHLDLVKLMLKEVIGYMNNIPETGEIMACPQTGEDDEGNQIPVGPCYYCPIKDLCPARDGRDGDWTDLRKGFDF